MKTITSPGVPEVALNDLLGAPGRDNPANLVIGGSPGRGKSSLGKNLALSWLEWGAGLHLIDPTEAREHERALSTFDDDKKVVIDPKKPKFSLDGLRIFPFSEAAERTIDHLLPQMGFATDESPSCAAQRFTGPRVTHRQRPRQPQPAHRTTGRTPARSRRASTTTCSSRWKECAPSGSSRRCSTTPCRSRICRRSWSSGTSAASSCPPSPRSISAHLHHQSTPSQRAAQALYGMAADLAQSLFFSRHTHPDVLLVEECAAWTHSPGGQRCANTVIRQGRKSSTAFVGISQAPRHDFGVLEDEFIEQRICLGFKTAAIAEDTLLWCDRDLDRHPHCSPTTSPTPARPW